MDILKAIFTRRSIRKFTGGEPIKEEDLKTILKAAFQAPSAHNYQPREYVVVRDKETIENCRISYLRKDSYLKLVVA